MTRLRTAGIAVLQDGPLFTSVGIRLILKAALLLFLVDSSFIGDSMVVFEEGNGKRMMTLAWDLFKERGWLPDGVTGLV